MYEFSYGVGEQEHGLILQLLDAAVAIARLRFAKDALPRFLANTSTLL
jgi:hypothetical protein